MPYIREEYTVNLNVTELHGKVVIQFDRPVQELPLEPEQAAELAKALAECTQVCVKLRSNH